MKQDANPHVKDSDILIHRDYRGQKVICAYRKFETPDWFLVSEMDLNEALAPVVTLKRVMFYTFFIAGVILLLSSLFFSRQVLNTLKSLTRNLKTALDDISEKKNTINTINVELRKRLQQCQALGQELKNSEEHIKNVINSISSGLVAFDEQYRITYYNEFFKNFTTAPDLKIGDAVSDRLSIFNDAAVRDGIAGIFKNNKPFRIDRHPMRIAGENITVSIHTLPIRGLDRIRGAILLINDITEQEFLRGQMADYEKLSALSQLALGAAHEINNPLQGITFYLELLLEEENDVERKQRAKEVLDNAYRISETVRGLLNFARPTPPKFTKVQVNKLISETVSFLHHQPLFRKLEIRENLNPDLPSVTADANQIRQVMINILLNAAQAITDNGVITVTTGKLKFEDRVEIIVADTGIGVPPENLGRLFEPFFTTKKGSGTGLGLSISYSYIKNHGGDISITSDVKNGTEVRIVLPIRQKGKIHSEVIE
jgi:signal transduction histidine kinase